ncbi:MAG TPA: response regulator transcription factor [Methylovorus sp.]|nr:response regulator transcription factor [Methylovorus sp.]
MRKHRVILVNGYRVTRYMLKYQLEASGHFVVTEAATSVEARYHGISPALLVVDISDPGKNGLETLCDLVHDFPAVPSLVVGGLQDDALRAHYLRLGCDAYLPRDASQDAILQTARHFASGRGGKPQRHTLTPSLVMPHLPHINLSARERQVFFKLTAGKSIPSVARELLISASSVSVFRCKILRKMHCSNNAELISYAFRHRLVYA